MSTLSVFFTVLALGLYFDNGVNIVGAGDVDCGGGNLATGLCADTGDCTCADCCPAAVVCSTTLCMGGDCVFEPNGMTCDLQDPACLNHCMNGGVCAFANGSPTCTCPSGYIGDICQTACTNEPLPDMGCSSTCQEFVNFDPGACDQTWNDWLTLWNSMGMSMTSCSAPTTPGKIKDICKNECNNCAAVNLCENGIEDGDGGGADAVANGETGIDCGGPVCPACTVVDCGYPDVTASSCGDCPDACSAAPACSAAGDMCAGDCVYDQNDATLCSLKPPADTSDQWSYPSGDAEDGWDGTCTAGMKQSPINIPTAFFPWPTAFAPLKYKNYFSNPHYNNKWFKGILEFNGYSIVWNFGTNKAAPFKKCGRKHDCPSILYGPLVGDIHSHAYYLLQINFHWGYLGDNTKGSEHQLNGTSYPLEMQMVHIEDKFIDFATGEYNFTAALEDPKGLAVLAIFFQVDNTKPQNMKPLQTIDNEIEGLEAPHDRLKRDTEDNDLQKEMGNLQRALEELHDMDSNRRPTRAIDYVLRLNPGSFIRKATNNGGDNTLSTYFTYSGSLTTPGCQEAVTWVVFTRPLSIVQVQLNAFAHKFSNNFRAIDTCAQCGLHSQENNLMYLVHGEIGGPFCQGGIWG